MNKLFSVCAAALLAAGCTDGAPDNDAIEDALNQYYESRGVCLPLVLNVHNPVQSGYITQVALGSQVIKLAGQDIKGNPLNRAAIRQMDYLDDEGFYKKSEVTEPMWRGSNKTHRVAVYELTEDGRKLVKTADKSPLFCVGRQKVEKIHWFTEPAPSNSLTVSRVSYDAVFVPEKWLSGLLKEGGIDKLPIAETQTKLNASVVKTSDGWKDSREVR